jgi:hypothetical protein
MEEYEISGLMVSISQKAFDCGDEFIHGKWLGNVIVGAGLFTQKTILISVPG